MEGCQARGPAGDTVDVCRTIQRPVRQTRGRSRRTKRSRRISTASPGIPCDRIRSVAGASCGRRSSGSYCWSDQWWRLRGRSRSAVRSRRWPERTRSLTRPPLVLPARPMLGDTTFRCGATRPTGNRGRSSAGSCKSVAAASGSMWSVPGTTIRRSACAPLTRASTITNSPETTCRTRCHRLLRSDRRAGNDGRAGDRLRAVPASARSWLCHSGGPRRACRGNHHRSHASLADSPRVESSVVPCAREAWLPVRAQHVR